jgi:hypothetical protein
MHMPLVFLAKLDTDSIGSLLSRVGDEALSEYNDRRIVIAVPFDPVISTLEDYLTEDNWYSVEMAVSEDGTLFYHNDRYGMMAPHFEELAALRPEDRWARALDMVRNWAAGDVARVVRTDRTDLFTDPQSAQAALRDFLARQSLHGDAYQLSLASDILFALEDCPMYPFSESLSSFADWPYLVDFSYTDESLRSSPSVMVFVDMHI